MMWYDLTLRSPKVWLVTGYQLRDTPHGLNLARVLSSLNFWNAGNVALGTLKQDPPDPQTRSGRLFPHSRSHQNQTMKAKNSFQYFVDRIDRKTTLRWLLAQSKKFSWRGQSLCLSFSWRHPCKCLSGQAAIMGYRQVKSGLGRR